MPILTKYKGKSPFSLVSYLLSEIENRDMYCEQVDSENCRINELKVSVVFCEARHRARKLLRLFLSLILADLIISLTQLASYSKLVRKVITEDQLLLSCCVAYTFHIVVLLTICFLFKVFLGTGSKHKTYTTPHGHTP